MKTKGSLKNLSVVIPARNEDHSIASTVTHLFLELNIDNVPHEIVVVNDGSSDHTRKVLHQTGEHVPALCMVRNTGIHEFGRAFLTD